MKVNDQWHNAPRELPNCDCVCLTRYYGGYHINCWNTFYKCWDNEDGSYTEFDSEEELEWMILEVEEESE